MMPMLPQKFMAQCPNTLAFRSKFTQGSFGPPPQNCNCSLSDKNKTGHWTDKQNAKYYAFLTKFHDKFTEKESRRHWKVFKSLADFIKTRNPNQCRSHHHKMKKDFASIQQILEFLRTKQPGLQERSEKYSKALEGMEFDDFGRTTNLQAYPNNFKTPANNEENLSYQMGEIPNIRFNCGEIANELGAQKQHDIGYKRTNDEYGERIHENMFKHELVPDFSTPHQLHANPFEVREYEKKREEAQNQQMRKSKVMQCHFYFNKWRASLEELMEMEENRFIY